MSRKWQKNITVLAGTQKIVELPGTVGIVVVSLDFGAGGTGTASETFYNSPDAVADTAGVVWTALTGISAAVANVSAVCSAQSTAVKLEAATNDQVFLLVGETNE
jgi:hypothetical protein